MLSACVGLVELPQSITNMRSLTNLDLEDCSGLIKMPVGIGELTSLERLGKFVVGPGSGCGGINELHGLNRLRGNLCITGLDNVKNAEEAKEFNLGSKPYLTRLYLQGQISPSYNDRALPQDSNSKNVLESLQLPPNIKTLGIKLWKEATCLPDGLQNVSSLETLAISECHSIMCLPAMGVQGLENSLERLEITKCGRLTSVSKGRQYLTSLQELNINECLEMELESEDFQHLNSLGELILKKIKALPEELRLTSLKRLVIYSCDSVKCFPVMGLNYFLERLKITKCGSLTSVSKGLQYLTSLQELNIGECPELELEWEDFQHVTSLGQLDLTDLRKLKALPEGMQYLETLQLEDIPELELESEDFLHLTTLRQLVLMELPKLKAWPKEGMQYLQKLTKIVQRLNWKQMIFSTSLLFVETWTNFVGTSYVDSFV